MKTILKSSRRFYLSALFSLAVHLMAFTLTIPFSPQKTSPRPPLAVELLSPEKLEQYRTVGIKNGSQHFSLPVSPPPTPSLSLRSLTPTPSTGSIVKKKSQFNNTRKGPSKLKTTKSDSIATSFLKQANLSIQFEAPEGVSEDELNDVEKTFWSFKKRAYETYVTSLLSTYRQLLQNQPQIQNTMRRVRNHIIAGQMVFDKKGNVLKIKIVRSSDQDDLQSLFEKSLRNIHKIPNPPKGLLSDGELTLYYQLVINRR